MTEYIYKHDKGEIIATYSKGGKLKKLIAKRGFLKVDLGFLFPFLEEELDLAFWEVYKPMEDHFFTIAKSWWFKFYKEKTNLNYRFQAKDGKALKEIGKFLTELSGDTGKALDSWLFILTNWQSLNAFCRNNMDLVFINSQLNKILNLLKNGQQTGTATKRNDADDLRRGFKS